jgi:hypothetical protein
VNEKVIKSIEELKRIVLDLHRSAGILDNMLQSIDEELESKGNIEYQNMFIKAQVRFYLDRKNFCDYGSLDQRTEQICYQLIEI